MAVSRLLVLKNYQQEDIEVTHEDQQRINSFATWNLKFKDYTLDYDEKKKELANLNDAEDELVIIDGDVHPYPFCVVHHISYLHLV
ncbi:prefoldin subunit 4 [Schistosoma japonicum]|nr:prefoldin subunit 4 [Schistosoma japonicum]